MSQLNDTEISRVISRETEKTFYQGYLQAMDLMMAHWPEDRKCGCEPVLSGQEPRSSAPVCRLEHIHHPLCVREVCYQYCWVQQVYQDAATKTGEVRE